MLKRECLCVNTQMYVCLCCQNSFDTLCVHSWFLIKHVSDLKAASSEEINIFQSPSD